MMSTILTMMKALNQMMWMRNNTSTSWSKYTSKSSNSGGNVCRLDFLKEKKYSKTH